MFTEVFRPYEIQGGKLSAGAPKAQTRLPTIPRIDASHPEDVKLIVHPPTNQFDSHLGPEIRARSEQNCPLIQHDWY